MTQIAPHKTVALTALVNHEPVTIAPDTPLGEVLEIMEQRKISCLLTVDGQRRPTGIFTEQDAVRLLVPVPGEHPPPQTMADVMHQPVFAMLSTTDYRDAYREMMARRYRHLAVVDALGKLVGVVSEGDFMHHMGFEYLVELKTVASAMTAHPLALQDTDTLASAARLMADKRISCVLVTHDGAPVGLVSERDMVRFSRMGPQQLQRPLAEVMSGPLQTVAPDVPLQQAKAEVGLLSQKLKAYKLMDHVSDAILVALTATGDVVEANASACRMLGYEHAQLLTLKLSALLRSANPGSGWAALRDALRLRGQGTFHLDLLASDGRAVPCRLDVRKVSEGGAAHLVLVARDLSDLMAQNEQIRLQIQALNALDHAVLITDAQASVVWVNAAFTRLTGYELAEAVGRKPAELVKSGRQDKGFYEYIWASILAGKVWRGELINRRKDGSLYDEEMSITPILAGTGGAITHFIAVKQDITGRKAQEAQLRQLSVTDPLTGVENRRGFMVQLERLHARQRRHGHPLSVLMFDLDWFKQVNDRHGHAVGDEVLIQVCQQVGQRLRRSDHLGRLGGEEFAVLLPDTHLEGARAAAEVLCQGVAMQPVMTSVGPVAVTVSVGVAEVDLNDRAEDALARADAALYRAKSLGRNRVEVAMPTMPLEP